MPIHAKARKFQNAHKNVESKQTSYFFAVIFYSVSGLQNGILIGPLYCNLEEFVIHIPLEVMK